MWEWSLSECGSGHCLNVGVAIVSMWEWSMFDGENGHCLNVGVVIV